MCDVAAHSHGGLILHVTEALQEFLKMEQTLKLFPEYIKLTDEEKARLEGFCSNHLNKAVKEVIESHKNDTDFDSGS